jgi:hypothetical protein
MKGKKMNNYTSGYVKIAQPPQPVGRYCVDDYFNIMVMKKPSWFHRKTVELILGWKWKDLK